MSLLRLEGAIDLGPLAGADAESLLSKVECALRAAQASSLKRTRLRITFRAGLFRLVPSWNVLSPIGEGEIELDGDPARELRYRLSFVQILVFSTVVTLVLGSFLLWVQPVWAIALFVVPAWWIWIFGGNYLIAKARVPAFIRRAIEAEGH